MKTCKMWLFFNWDHYVWFSENRPFVNLGIGIGIGNGIGIGTDITNAIISGFIKPMDPKISRAVTYDERTPPTQSRDTLILWSRDK